MSMVRPSDVVLHYATGAVRAISQAAQPARTAPQPASFPGDLWEQTGWLLPVELADLGRPIALEEIPAPLRKDNPQRMFNRLGGVNQGYLYPVDVDWFAEFARLFADRLPAEVVAEAVAPAEVTGGAEEFLRSLIGAELRTLSGKINIITGVHDGIATVTTSRSPDGQPVAVTEVQDALDQLRNRGSVVCSPSEVGYRSAFIGAVLQAIPGASAALDPPTVSLTAPATDMVAPADAGTNLVIHQGPLDIPVTRNVRAEQPALRRTLIGNKSHARCALCGEEMPVDLLIAAHIKQRSLCNDSEKLDLLNIGMLACKLGCDDLYELGYISVDAAGTVITVEPSEKLHGTLVAGLIARLQGSPCLAFTAANAHYYQWHRDSKFAGTVPASS